MPHRLSSRKEPPAPTHQPSRATFCIRRTQDAIYKCIAPGAKHRARGHMDAQGAWGGPRPPFGAFMNRPRSKISGDTLLEQMRRDQQIIPSRSIIQFGDDDDLHARAHLRAHNDYKFAQPCPRNSRGGDLCESTGQHCRRWWRRRWWCEQSALRRSPNRRHRAAGAWSTDLTSRIQRKLDRPVRRGGSEGPP